VDGTSLPSWSSALIGGCQLLSGIRPRPAAHR
jgi:hypothetical protein